MEALVLAGGYGSRLFGEDFDPKAYIPKGLVDVGGKPCIEHTLGAFSPRLIDRIFLITNNEGERHYNKWVSESEFGTKVDLIVEKESRPGRQIGTLRTIEYALIRIGLLNPLLITATDSIFSKNQDELITGFTSGARIATYKASSLEEAKKYGVLKIVGGNRIVSAVEKPKNPPSKYVGLLCQVWDTQVFRCLYDRGRDIGTNDLGGFINYLIFNEIEVEPFLIDGVWFDIGTKEDLERARNYFRRDGK